MRPNSVKPAPSMFSSLSIPSTLRPVFSRLLSCTACRRSAFFSSHLFFHFSATRSSPKCNFTSVVFLVLRACMYEFVVFVYVSAEHDAERCCRARSSLQELLRGSFASRMLGESTVLRPDPRGARTEGYTGQRNTACSERISSHHSLVRTETVTIDMLVTCPMLSKALMMRCTPRKRRCDGTRTFQTSSARSTGGSREEKCTSTSA